VWLQDDDGNGGCMGPAASQPVGRRGEGMKRKHWTVLFLVGFVVALVAAACGGDGSGAAGDTGAGAGTTSGGEGGDLFGTGGGYESLTLDPPEATIVVDDGVSSPVSFKAYLGSTEVHPSSWYV